MAGCTPSENRGIFGVLFDIEERIDGTQLYKPVRPATATKPPRPAAWASFESAMRALVHTG